MSRCAGGPSAASPSSSSSPASGSPPLSPWEPTGQPLFEPVSYGIWELVAGTFNVVFWSLLMALPVGLAAAIYLSEYAHPRTRRILKPLLEALAGVPTVV